jgi:hypothetical protein
MAEVLVSPPGNITREGIKSAAWTAPEGGVVAAAQLLAVKFVPGAETYLDVQTVLAIQVLGTAVIRFLRKLLTKYAHIKF